MRRKNKGVNITFSLYLARRRPLLAPPRRQSLDPPPGHANREPRIPLGAGPCWRRPAGKALIRRRATPTGRALLPKVPLFPAGLHLFPVGPYRQAVLPPHSNRNLVGITGIKREK